MKFRIIGLVVALLSILLGAHPAKAKDVVMSGAERSDYFTQALSLALSYAPEKQYQIKFINFDVPKLRALKLIANHEGIDVIPAGATVERQELVNPIRLPLLKGLFGWRVPLVLEKNKDMFLQKQTDVEFKQHIAGQLYTWSDTKILESNGIKVLKGSKFLGLFTMLEKERFDYFPRSMLEVEEEYQRFKHHGIIIEPNIILHYPTAYYFYVSKQNVELHNDIRNGLELAIADGRLNTLFKQHFGDIITRINLKNRRLIELNNPFLPPDVPLSRKKLWLDVEQYIDNNVN